MTDKELHKLGRRELLQLLLAQGREAEKAKAKLAEVQEEMAQLEEGYERLKNRLNDKDAQILQLRESLQAQRQGQGLLPEEELHMDFAQVRGGESLPPPAAYPQQRPAYAPPQQPPVYAPPQQQWLSPQRAAPTGTRKPRHAQGSAPPAPQPPAREARPPREPQPAPRVMEVVQVVGGKLQPQSRMLLRPQRVEEGT